ncbi:prenyltransferase/squalene oxidase repeat-containing protein [Streptomyces sp. NPDC048182]|uniref:prenyltransferase/squalene oxidase repeat-containing protein n=1 Tax=Streptomyces sp. NPDC048182 TaxID=3365507 RepID=UPI0037198164
MNVRRSAVAVLAAIAVAGVGAVPAVAAGPSPSASTPDGLYGSGDPQYDGVWRQSLALLAQHTVKVTPAAEAVEWLTSQQCADGAFPAFRPDPAKACDAKTVTDTNSTAAAVQALAALGGHDDVVKGAVGWLRGVQNKDGGWGYNAGGPSDANSTSVVIGALAAAGTDPGSVVKGGKKPTDALLTFALPCGTAAKDAGAFAFQPDKGKLVANPDATAAAVLGALGKGLVAEAGKATGNADGCGAKTPAQGAAHGAGYLTRALAKDGHLTSALAGADPQPDYGNTADAVVALAAQGGADKAAKPLAWLEQNSAAWAKQSGPAAYAQLILAAHATGSDPRHFGEADLVTQLNATGPAPQEKKAQEKPQEKKDEGSGFGVWWFVGVCLVFGIGIGFLLSGRNKKSPRP